MLNRYPFVVVPVDETGTPIVEEGVALCTDEADMRHAQQEFVRHHTLCRCFRLVEIDPAAADIITNERT